MQYYYLEKVCLIYQKGECDTMSYKFDKLFMSVARLHGEMSYCTRRKVGAVLVRNKRIVACGWNGTVSGAKNQCEDFVRDVNGNVIEEGIRGRYVTNEYVVHAEQNVISFCAKYGIATEGLTLYITCSPCKLCAKLLVQAGITDVVYTDEYSDTDSLTFLTLHGISVRRYSET